MGLSFGVTVLPDPPYGRFLELLQLAERHGFEYGWTYDSHVLWQDSFPTLALAAQATERMKLGHMVTNPGTRDPTVVASAYATLQDISEGRMIMGIGRGDSARRVIGQKPVPVGRFEETLKLIKPFMNGEQVHWNDTDLKLGWARTDLPEIEMHVAGYGPKALGVAGRVGDGVIIQLADPEIIQWIMGTARAAAEEAGRDPAALKCIVCAPSHITDDIADAREQVRWFPAMVSNHVMDLIERYGADGDTVPKALTDYVQARKFYDYNEHSRVGAKHGEFVTDDLQDAREQVRWFPAMVSNHVQDLIDRYGTDGSSVPKALTDYVEARKFYDYNEHSRVGAKHGEFVTDEICDRFCVLGTAEQAKAKLQELQGVGVDQFNIYLMTHGQEATLQAYGDDVIPELAGVAAG